MTDTNKWEKVIWCVMNKLGIPAHLSGRRYISAAMIYMLQQDSRAGIKIGDVYSAVAIGDKNPANISRSIRTALGHMIINERNTDLFMAITSGGIPKKITNSEFLFGLAEAIRYERLPDQLI